MKLANIDLSQDQIFSTKKLLGDITCEFIGTSLCRKVERVDAFVFTKHASLRSISLAMRFKEKSIPGIYVTDGIFDFGNFEKNMVGRYPWYSFTGFPPLADYVLSCDKKYLMMLEYR